MGVCVRVWAVCITVFAFCLFLCCCAGVRVCAGHSIGVCLSANVSPMNARGSRQQGRPSNGPGLFHVLCLCVCVCTSADKSIYSHFICVHKFVRIVVWRCGHV